MDREVSDLIQQTSNIMIGFVTALVAIYIPVGVFIFEKLFEKNNVFKELDEKIVTSSVFNIKKIVSYLFLIFVSIWLFVFFQDLYIFTLALFFLSLIRIIDSLNKTYQRVFKKNIFRKEYLSQEQDIRIWEKLFLFPSKSITESRLIAESFLVYLKNKRINSDVLLNVLSIWDSLLKEKNYKIIFTNNVFFSELLEIYFEYFSISLFGDLKKQDRDLFFYIRSLVCKIIWLLEKEDWVGSFVTLSTLKKHIKIYGDIYSNKDKSIFLKMILSNEYLIKNEEIMQLFLEGSVYQIQFKDINGKYEIIKVIINYFRKYISDISNWKKRNSKVLENLFDFCLPWLDKATFFVLLSFYSLWYDPENRVKSFYKHNVDDNFILVQKSFDSSFPSGKKKNETVILLSKYFDLKKDDLEKYISDCSDDRFSSTKIEVLKEALQLLLHLKNKTK